MSRRSRLRHYRQRIQRQQARQQRQQNTSKQTQDNTQETAEATTSLWSYGSVADSATMLRDSRVTGGLRYGAAQNIGHTLGNSALQRLAAGKNPTLRMGSTGAAVQEMQGLLNSSGASISADGIFGAKTRQAVVGFQQSAGLSPDGIVGQMTWGKLHGGGVTIEPAATSAPANPAAKQMVLAKLNEIKKYMHDAGKAAPTAAQPETPTAAEPQTVEHAHDSAEGEEESSWWDQAKEAAGSAYDSASEAAGSAYNTVSEAAGSAYDSASEAASEAWNTVSDTASEAWNTASEAAGSAWGAVEDTASEAWNQTQQIVGGIQQTVNEGVDWAVNQAQEIANDVGAAVDEFTEDVKQQFGEAVAAVEEFVNDVAYYLAHPEEALQKLEEILNDLKKKAGELLGDDPEEDVPNRFSGQGEISEVAAASTVCHDSAIPQPHSHKRRRKLRVNLSADSVTKHETPKEGSLLNYDAVHPTLSYGSFVGMNDDEIAKVPSTDFGTTGAKFRIDQVNFTAERFTDYVTVSGRLFQHLAWQITRSPGRTDVPTSLEGIDETNWKQAADDLDPDVQKTNLGAPRREKFWAKDITEGHEKFHVTDGDTYAKDKILPALQTEFGTRTVDVPWLFDREESVKKQIRAITDELVKTAAKMKNDYMGEPGEKRAYAGDEPAYRARAKAIREKAKQEGWDGSDKKKKK